MGLVGQRGGVRSRAGHLDREAVVMTATDIALAIAAKLDPRQVLLVPNVSWGFLPWGESDLLAVSKAGFLTEYEIKTTLSDLKRERKKKRWTTGHMEMAFRVRIRRYYIAIPRSMLDKAMAVPRHPAIGRRRDCDRAIGRQARPEIPRHRDTETEGQPPSLNAIGSGYREAGKVGDA